MGSFADLSIGDIARALARYRPVVVTVLAILVALVVLPKPDSVPGLASTTGGGGIRTPAPVGAASASSAVSSDAATDDAFAASSPSAVTSFPSSFSSESPSSSGASSGASSTFPTGSSSSADSGSDSGDVGPISSGTSSVDTTSGTVTEQPLQVVGKTWATRSAGTPLAKDGVPAGTLPVGARATLDDKLSFVRLQGTGSVLGFAEEASGTRTTSGAPAVQACRVTSPWSDGEAIAISQAPSFDRTKCVAGQRSASGAWIFDLASFDNRTDSLGFALVPSTGSVDFQVAFRL